jgi:transcription initiation factor TFIID subunit 2
MSLRPTPRTPQTPLTPRTPKMSKKHHNKHELDNIPTQRFKVGYQKVTLDVDLEQNSISGETEITILPLDSHLKQVKLDCRGMQIKSIIVNQRRAHFTYDDFMQNEEYMNDPDNPVLGEYVYDPHFDSNSKNIGVNQHNMTRAKFYPLFSDQNEPDDPSSSFSTCTSELTINVPESIKLRLQNSSKISFSPAGTNRSLHGTPNTASTMLNSDKVYTPLNVKIIYTVKNSKNGIQFHGGKHTNISRDLWYCYTLNNDFGCSTSSWVPCIDNFHEKPAWDINVVVPKTVGNIGKSLIIGTKEAEKALRKLAMQNMETSGGTPLMKSTSSSSINGDTQKIAPGAIEESNEDDEDKPEDQPIVVAVPDFVSSRESPHPVDVAKKFVNFQFYNPVCAHHLGFAIGCFEKMSMVDLKPGTDDFTFDDQGAVEEIKQNAFPIDAANSNKVPTLIYFHPGRKQEVINTTLFLYKALEYYSKEFSSFPFTSYTLLFIDGLSADICSFAGMTMANSNLLYGPGFIEPMFSTTEKLAIALAEQYAGVNVLPKTLNDIWCTIGIARFMSYQFLKKLFGVNYYKFSFQERRELLCELDIDKRPLANQAFRFPINFDQDLDFIKLKAPLVLTILDRRITKTDKLFGLSRVIPKIFLQAMSNDLINGNNLSTAHFQRVCEKVAHHRLESFFQNWVHNSGVPIMRIQQKYNKKRLFIEMSIRQMQTSKLKGDDEDADNPNKEKVDAERNKAFVDQANTFLTEAYHFKPQSAFVGPVTVRIHEADGSPYEHIMNITDTVTKLDIQYNAKYKKRKKEKVDDEDEGNDAKKKEKNDSPKVRRLGEVLVTKEDIRNWDLKEDEPTAVDPESKDVEVNADDDKDKAFEWLRFDADNEWICKIKINLSDEALESQLKQDKDVEAQLESIRHFSSVSKPTLYHAKVLLRTLIDSRYYFKIRVEAAKGLGRISCEENDHIGMRLLLKCFKFLYCYDNQIVAGYNELDQNQYLPKPNDFTKFADMFVSKAILQSLSNVRNKNGDAPIELKRILLHIFKYIDNSVNKFDDTEFYCELIGCISSLIVASKIEIPSLDMDSSNDSLDLPSAQNSNEEFVYAAMKELNRCAKMDELSPSHNHEVTKKILEEKIKFVKIGLAKMNFMDLLKFTTEETIDSIRLVAFEGILLAGGLRNKHILKYFFDTLKLDESITMRYELNKTLCRIIGIASERGIRSVLDDVEFLQSAANDCGTGMIQLEDRGGLNAMPETIAQRSMKSAISFLRNELGIGQGLRGELWDSSHSCLIPINTRRNIFDIMMVLYEPRNSFLVTTKLPGEKQIVMKVKSIVNSEEPGKSSFVIAVKREARFKIQIPTFKLKKVADVAKPNKRPHSEIEIPSEKKEAEKKIKKQKLPVIVKRTLHKFEIKIRHPKLQIDKKKVIRHAPNLPLRYVRFNLNTKEVTVSTNEKFSVDFESKLEHIITLRIDSKKWRNHLNTNKPCQFLVKVEGTVDASTSTVVTNGITNPISTTITEIRSTSPVTDTHVKVEQVHEDVIVNSHDEPAGHEEMLDKEIPLPTIVGSVTPKVDDSTDKGPSTVTVPLDVTTPVDTAQSKSVEKTEPEGSILPLEANPDEKFQQTSGTTEFPVPGAKETPEPVKSINWGRTTQGIVGKLNPMKRSSNSPSPPQSLKLALGRSRSRPSSQSPESRPDEKQTSDPKIKKGPKIKIRLK